MIKGKHWHQPKKAFRPTAGQTAYAKRAAQDKELAVIKAHEKELKEEKEAERQVGVAVTAYMATHLTFLQRRIQAIKDRRAAKEERERYEKMAEKMHKKRVERLKRREKRNKMLKS